MSGRAYGCLKPDFQPVEQTAEGAIEDRHLLQPTDVTVFTHRFVRNSEVITQAFQVYPI